MNITIAAVGTLPGFAAVGGRVEDALAIAGLALVGLVFLIAAARLCGRGRAHPAQYAVPRL